MDPAAGIGVVLTWAYGLCAGAYMLLAVVALSRGADLLPARRTAATAAAVLTALWAVAMTGLPAAAGLLPTMAVPPVVLALEAMHTMAWLVVLAEVAGLWQGRRLALVGGGAVLGAGALAAGVGLSDWIATTAPHLMPVALLVLAVVGLALMESILRQRDVEERWAIKHLCLGLAVVFAFDVFLFADALLVNRLDANMVAARALVDALCAAAIGVSLFRSMDGGRRLRPSREILLKSTTLLATGVYLLVMSLVGYGIRGLGGSWGPASQAAFLAGSLLLLGVLVLSGASRARARVWVAKNFFAHRYDYRAEWLRVTRTLAGGEGEDAAALHDRVIRAVCDIVEGTAGALWLLQERDRAFIPSAVWNLSAGLPAVPVDSALVGFLQGRRWVVDLDEMRRRPDLYGFDAPEWLTALPQAWLVLPLPIRGDVIGFVLVAAPRLRRPLTWEDFDVLKTVGRHAAATLATEKALNELSDARRLEAFSKRTAFLVHDVKNIVSQLDLMLKNAERVGDDPEFQKDMLDTTAGAVAKLRALLAELRHSRAPAPPALPPGAPAPDVGEQVAQAVTRWRRRHPDLAADLAGAAGGGLPIPPAETFGSVLDHLLQNSIEAAGAAGRVTVRLVRGGGTIAVEVADDGVGMDLAYVRDRLFRPLDSSKADGYGLGAFQCRELVREMGGRLEVSTEPGKGTIMRIVLPLDRTAAEGPARATPQPTRETV
ncbi:XrtA/PEP-CTERM system histidine kinase PrsK [Caenispirillum bisanense]|uniref:histidine kinase n=1 Tax=Caenispirillum bisanense TaxID=414052 RepID=A0A286G7A2_9PROT|nr:XrtA/PEP-CTERM system histidine kinase PrsK [Caenispirillum bisanense]SOD91009.1 putative PEP-CTERM system histidine kinase [Caenispirillum bisanense]